MQERSLLRDEENRVKKTVEGIDSELRKQIELENRELAAGLEEAGNNTSQVRVASLTSNL